MVDILHIKEGMKVCDPCCGSGGFLIKAFENVQSAIDKDIQDKVKQVAALKMPEDIKQKKITLLLSECDKTRNNSRYYHLCHNYFYGVDANARMARTAKMNMVMHGDGHVGVYQHDGLLNVGGVFENRFDAVLFGKEYTEKVYKPLKAYASAIYRDGSRGKKLNELYQIANSSTEILFIERCINLLKPGGIAGIVLPEGVFDNRAIRQWGRESAPPRLLRRLQ